MASLSKLGGWLNDLMGVTSSSAKQFEQNMTIQKNAQNFTKWQMGNAHQQEVSDLQKAGLNPVLSAGGDGAGGTPSMGSTSPGVAGGDPISMIMNLINTANNSARTNSEIDKNTADIKNQTDKTNAEVQKLLKEAGYTDKQIDFYNKTGFFPGATITTSTSAKGPLGIGGSSSVSQPISAKKYANGDYNTIKKRKTVTNRPNK